MSYWGQLNRKQVEVVKSCLSLTDPLHAKLTINQLLATDIPTSDLAFVQPNEGATADKRKKNKTPLRSRGSGSWFTSSNEKSLDDEDWHNFKKRLLKKNKKQMTLLMAAELHEMRERDKHVTGLESEVKELRAEVARLKEQLAKNSTSLVL